MLMPRILLPFGAWCLAVVPAAGEELRFSRDILPILSDTCFACHGPDEAGRKGGLRLDLHESALGQGKSGAAAVVPGDPAKSEVIARILSTDAAEVMPPPKALRKLTAEQKELLQRWVAQGAPWGKHWAYEPPVRPPLPEVTIPASQSQNPIDAFVAARLQQEGLAFSPEAPPATLARRLSLDLTGLPPSAHEFEFQAADFNVEAFIDHLLASPRFGERWAWDWLDAARYADTNGYQGDPERTMWPWRDWVVDAINANMPYDRFTIEQIAGDLLPDATRSQKLASGFHRNNMHNGEGGRIAEETRVENVFDRVETTATLWLAATFNCCRCHDHKYDPLAQRDYYALYDIFNQMSETGAGRDGKGAPALDFSTPTEEARVAEARRKFNAVSKEVEAFELKKFPRPQGAPLTESDAAKLPGNLSVTLADREPARRTLSGVVEALAYFETDGNDPAYAAVLKKHLNVMRARDTAQNNVTQVMIMDQLAELRDTFILDKGAYDKPTEVRIGGAMPVALAGEPPPEARANRLDLARWLVARDNPLTARVTVNRYWQALFGTGLVKSVEDFGLQGEKPSHPELLDWLAVELMDSGWDIKHLIRLIVTSRAYRQSSKVTPALFERDPENRLLARGPRHRLPAWMLRDLALSASGLLNPAQGGPSVKPYQPAGIWEEATFGKKSYVQDHGDALYRRTLYTFWRRIVGPTTLFDNAARQVCEVKAKRTNTPLHALTTLNDITYVEAARALAQRVLLATPDDADARLTELYRLALFRAPTAEEQAILSERLGRLRKQYHAEPEAAAALLQVGESARDETLPATDHAAFTVLCQLVLNLDEALCKE